MRSSFDILQHKQGDHHVAIAVSYLHEATTIESSFNYQSPDDILMAFEGLWRTSQRLVGKGMAQLDAEHGRVKETRL